MKHNYLEIDFEFTGISEPKLELICCSLKSSADGVVGEFWLHNGEDRDFLIQCLRNYKTDHILLAFGVSAEASALISLDLGVLDIKWICNMAEYRCLSNHNHDLMYGKHLMEGKVKTIFPPKKKWEDDDGSEPSGQIRHSLAEACYKFLGVLIDTDRKTTMRDICIRGNAEEIAENRKEIQEYCTSDIKYLLPLLKAQVKHYKKLLTKEDFSKLMGDMLLRGNTMANNAIMERAGYPIAFNNLRNFALQIPDILNECAEDINEQFPERNVFVLNKRTGSYTKKEKPIKDWIENDSGFCKSWRKTPTKTFQLSLDAFGDHFNYQHSYPRGNFGAQMVRFLKLKQSLNGFSPKTKGKKTFWDNVGLDRRVRSYLNPYGSLSSRYQPPSTGFLFLKPAWMRSLCVPPKGKMIVGIDYKSEEFLISGLFSKDEKMIEAYQSGDVYLAFAKDSGMVPQDATKASHPIERQSAKSAVLGISYLMTKFGLSKKMTQDLGKEVTEDEAQDYIDKFNDTYSVHYDAVMDFLETHSDRGYTRLHDGWILFGDNENFRSVANFPKQGCGGVVLREAVHLANKQELCVAAPLHDALYFEVDIGDWEAVTKCCEVMKKAFISPYIDTDMERYAKSIMLDVECWSPELEKSSMSLGSQKISLESIHIDERAKNEYDKFSKYFKKADWQLL